jgi:hypothetical protein
MRAQTLQRQIEPTEAQEQSALLHRIELVKKTYPDLQLIYAVPNGGARDVIGAVNLKDQGVKKGVPDLVLPVARGGYHGWYGELKRKTQGQLSDEQRDWLRCLCAQGYWATWHRGADEMWNDLMWYLSLPHVDPQTTLPIRPMREIERGTK